MDLDNEKKLFELNEKQKIERATFDLFLAKYNQEYNCDYEFDSHTDKPDFKMFSPLKKQIIGVETTVLFETDYDAKNLLGRGKAGQLMPVRSIGIVQQRLDTLINKKLNDINKFKDKNDLFLVIREHSRCNIFEHQEFNRIKHKLKYLKSIFIISAYKGLIKLDI